MSKAEWQKVFQLVHKKARDIRESNPNMVYSKALKQAWKDKEVIAAKDAYNKKYKKDAKNPATKKKPASKKKQTKNKILK